MITFMLMPYCRIVNFSKARLGGEDMMIGDECPQANWYFQCRLVLYNLPNIYSVFFKKLYNRFLGIPVTTSAFIFPWLKLMLLEKPPKKDLFLRYKIMFIKGFLTI